MPQSDNSTTNAKLGKRKANDEPNPIIAAAAAKKAKKDQVGQFHLRKRVNHSRFSISDQVWFRKAET
jgi:pyridoxine 5'-phosphate synthase PdxJ